MQQPSSPPQALEKLRDLIACAVCLEVVKDPKLLPCQHSFCFGCLEKIRAIDNRAQLICPLCRMVHNVEDLSKLPVDFMKNSLLEIVEEEREQDKELYCGNCDGQSEDEKAVGFCEQCDLYLCVDHQKAHIKDKNTKGHSVISIEKKENKTVPLYEDPKMLALLGLSGMSLTDERRYCVIQRTNKEDKGGKSYVRFIIVAQGASQITQVTLRAKDKVIVDNLDIRGEHGASVSADQICIELPLPEELLKLAEAHANIEVLLQTISSAGEKRSIIMPLLHEVTEELPQFKEKESILLSLTAEFPRPIVTLDTAKIPLPPPVFPRSYIRGNEEPAGILLYRKPAFHVQALQSFKVFVNTDHVPFMMELEEARLIGVKPGTTTTIRIVTDGYDREMTVPAMPSSRIHTYEVYLWWFKMEIKDYGIVDVKNL